jgi:hypothetical protein
MKPCNYRQRCLIPFEQKKDICKYASECVSRVTKDCIPNYKDCMAYKFYILKEEGRLSELEKIGIENSSNL